MHFVNAAQFLNATLVLALPPAAIMSLVTRIYPSGYDLYYLQDMIS